MTHPAPKRPSWKRTIWLLDRLYRLLLHAYPRTFRREYGPRMAQLLRDRCRDTLQRHGLPGLIPLSFATLYDLAINAFLERYPIMQKTVFNLLLYAIALGTGLLVGYGDLHAKEVQGTVLIILVLTFLFGVLQPRHAWRWALLIGLGVPLVNWGGLIFGYHGTPTGLPLHLDTLIALIPAFIGAYCGVGASKVLQSLRHLST